MHACPTSFTSLSCSWNFIDATRMNSMEEREREGGREGEEETGQNVPSFIETLKRG